jgi:hypothetical protein
VVLNLKPQIAQLSGVKRAVVEERRCNGADGGLVPDNQHRRTQASAGEPWCRIMACALRKQQGVVLVSRAASIAAGT